MYCINPSANSVVHTHETSNLLSLCNIPDSASTSNVPIRRGIVNAILPLIATPYITIDSKTANKLIKYLRSVAHFPGLLTIKNIPYIHMHDNPIIDEYVPESADAPKTISIRITKYVIRVLVHILLYKGANLFI